MDAILHYSQYDEDNYSNSCFNHSIVRHLLYTASWISITSGFLSSTGSLLIMFTYLRWKDIRQSTARVILFWLALAELLSCISYIVGSTLSSIPYDSISRETYEKLCTATSIFVTYFPKTAILWTIFLAVHFVITLVLRSPRKKWLMLVFHLVGWTLPLLVTIPAASTNWLGHGEFTQGSSWCFISDNPFINKSKADFGFYMSIYFTMEIVCGLMWDVGAVICVSVCYGLILVCNRCRWRMLWFRHQKSGYATEQISGAIAKIDMKLMLIPFVFVLLRLCVIARYGISIAPSCHIPRFNTTTQQMKGFCIADTVDCSLVFSPFIVYSQAFLVPLQGFLNAVLFVLLSKIILCRLIRSLMCCKMKKSEVTTPLLGAQESKVKVTPAIYIKKKPKLPSTTFRGSVQDNECYGE